MNWLLKHDLALFGFSSTLFNLVWYAIAAGVSWLAFYALFPAFFSRRRISDREPTRRQISREVLHTVRSIIVFGLVTGVVFAASSAWGWTQIYWKVDQYGTLWFFSSVGAMVVLHDAYFYWTHRMMHHPRLFHAVHQMHHRSFAPTPWATYAFTTPEAFIQAGALLFIVMIIPVHPVAVGIWFFGQTFYNAVILHSGHENYPRWFIRTPAARALTSATHHSVHHEKSHGNFGLYFNLWDSLLDTNHADYAQRFEKAKSRRVATRR